MVTQTLHRGVTTLLLAGTLALCASPAQAAGQQVPPSAEPGRLIPSMPTPSERFDVLKDDGRALSPAEAGMAEAPPGAETVRLILHSLQVDGMRSYRPDEVEAIYKPYIGQEISKAKLYAIANALQQKYFDDGYTLTKVIVPKEIDQSGNVHLQVIEGYVGQIEVDAAYASNPAVADAVARIRAMRPLNTRALERLLLVLNDMRSIHLSAVLATLNHPTPEEAQPGSVRLILKQTAASAPRGQIALNNYGSNYTGPWQALATTHFYDVGPANSDLALTVSGTDPLSEQRYGAFQYSVPLWGASGARLSLAGLWARTEPGDRLKSLKVYGKTEDISATLSYPLTRQRNESWLVDGGLSVNQARTKLAGTKLYDDRLRVLRMGSNYSFSDAWDGFNAVDLHVAHGLDGLGASNAGSALSRTDGKPDFTKLEFFTGRVQQLPRNFELYGLVSGQYAFDPLLSSEEFGFGGSQLGRGYDPSEITGDDGVAATLELRYNVGWRVYDTPVQAQPYAFYDIGKVWNRDRGAHNQESAASAGVGMRFTLNDTWSGNILAAIPLTKGASNPPNYANATGPRFLVSVSRSF